MATPLSASTALSAFKAEGLDVREVRLWATHNRNHVGAWGPVNGVMIHHTGPYSSTSGMVALCYNGRDDLPGPLCHGVIDKTGAVHLVGWGRANHAGRGDSDVLDAVKAETKLPVDDQGNVDGNPHFYGFELINAGNGKDPWPEVQVEAAARAAAALCRKHSWTAESVIGHKEWQPGKIDPTFDMGDFRARVAVLLKDDSPAEPAKPSPPKFPGRNAFGPGKSNASILLLGQQLVRRGFGKHYRVGPSRDWGEADRLNVVAFQRAQGWTGSNADGYPGPETWRRLFS